MRIHRDAYSVSYKSASSPWETREGRRGSSGAQGKCHRGYGLEGWEVKEGAPYRNAAGYCPLVAPSRPFPAELRPSPTPSSRSGHTHTQLRFLSGQRNGLSPRVTGILNLSTTDFWGQIILLWEVVLCILGCFNCIPPVPLEARKHPPAQPPFHY